MSVPATIPFPAPAPAPSTPPGYSRSIGFALMPEIVQWIAPAALILSVITTFFSWNGVYPGGHAVYTQSPWGALFGNYSTDAVGDKVMLLDTVREGSKVSALKESVHWNFLMLPYLPGLLLTTLLAIGFTILPALKIKLPAQVEKLLPWRMGVVAVLALLLTGTVFLQSLIGFGLENAIKGAVDSSMKEEIEKAKTDQDKTEVDIKHGKLLGVFSVRQTTANRLAILLNFVAVLGAAGAVLMTRRVDKPAPRIEVMW